MNTSVGFEINVANFLAIVARQVARTCRASIWKRRLCFKPEMLEGQVFDWFCLKHSAVIGMVGFVWFSISLS